MSEETLFDFPCQYPIKAMGKNDQDFAQVVADIVLQHSAEFDEKTIITKPSKDSNYLSVTITILATSKAQLNAIYQDLSSHPQVLMTL